MENQNSNLEGGLSRVPIITVPEPNENYNHDKCKIRRFAAKSGSDSNGTSADYTDGAEGNSRPGAEVLHAIICRGEIYDTHRGSAPILVAEYIDISNHFPFIDVFPFRQLREDPGSMLTVETSRGYRPVRHYEECWSLRWMHCTNRPKELRLEIVASILWARHDNEFKYVTQMYALFRDVGDRRFCVTHTSTLDPRIVMDTAKLYFYDARKSWAKDMSMEVRCRRPDRGL